jgi:hypothetical protein
MSFQSAKNHILDNPSRLEGIVDDAINGADSNDWLVQAIAHGFSTGNWLFLSAQCKKHIEPDIDMEASALATSWALQKEADRMDQSMDGVE